MKSLLIAAILRGCVALGFLIAAIVVLIKKPKLRIFISVVCFIFAIILPITSISYYKDIANQETETFIGTFVDDQSVNRSRPFIFNTSDGKTSVYAGIADDYNNYFEKGKRYKVEYYKNTHIIYSVELVE